MAAKRTAADRAVHPEGVHRVVLHPDEAVRFANDPAERERIQREQLSMHRALCGHLKLWIVDPATNTPLWKEP